MNVWVYDRNGNRKLRLRNLDYSGEYMGDCFVQTTVESDRPIVWALGDYLEYRGERFTLNYIPSGKIQNSGWMYVYDQVRFDSVIDELVRCTFKDVVAGDSGVHWTGMTTFSFTCEDVRVLAERIQANLDFVYGDGKWKVEVDKYVTKKDRSVSVQDKTVWDALQLVYDVFKSNFIIRGRVIRIGVEGRALGHVFKFGMGRGLTSLERNSESNQQIITRLRAYGNTTNLPTNYYKYANCYVVSAMWNLQFSTDSSGGYRYAKFVPSKDVLKDENFYWQKLDTYAGGTKPNAGLLVRLRYEGGECYGYPYKDTSGLVWYMVEDSSFLKWASLHQGGVVNVVGDSALRMSKLLRNHPEVVKTSGYPNNMAVTRLMLPGFLSGEGSRSLGDGYWLKYSDGDVYIESAKHSYGVREGAVYIDGTDNDVTDEDVYPSLEEMTADDLKQAGIVCDLPAGDNGKLDEFAYTKIVDDDGDNTDSRLTGTVAYVWTKDVGFNPKSYLMNGETARIHVKTGMCAGCEFDIGSIYEETMNGHKSYRLMLARKQDELGYYRPNRTYRINAGDKFVFVGIRMPDAYVQAASERLLRLALLYLKENDTVKFTFTPTLDPLFMETDYRALGKESMYWTMKEGDVMEFNEQERLNTMGSLFIANLGIKENSEGLPEYTVSLEEKKSASTLSKIASQVSATLSGSYGGVTPGIVEDLINTRSEDYVKRKEDDTAKGRISFDAGLNAKSSTWEDAAADGIVEYYE